MAHRVFVGLSGGVDSAVSAALLKEWGYDVVGVFIKIWQPEFIECTWAADRLDAMRVCAALAIPFREIDLSREYKNEIIDAMVRDYARGVTPNPDVLCNTRIKFGAFSEWARAEGARAIATGHYAQKRQAGGRLELLRAHDAGKDQSYFLYRLRQSDLGRVIFPIGGMMKSEVRSLARRFGLPVSEKPDSQGLCFVGEVSMRDFLGRFIPLSVGPVVDQSGAIIGEHDGAALFTIGQRHGFSIFPGTTSEPLYVTHIDAAANTVRVSARRKDASVLRVELNDVHWIGRMPSLPYTVAAQSRYHEKPVSATLSRDGERLTATFAEPHLASPGQSLVFYMQGRADADVCLGGGIIVPSVSTDARTDSLAGSSMRAVQ